MSKAEQYDVLVLGSGAGGKLLSWTLAREGKRTATVERKLIGGSCPNVACLFEAGSIVNRTASVR